MLGSKKNQSQLRPETGYESHRDFAEKSQALPQSNGKRTQIWALIGALVLAVLLFALVPLTQMLSDVSRKDIVFREMSIAAPPPPKAPPAPEEDVTENEVEPPKLEESFQELTLQQLELSLDPGMGDALAMGTSAFPVNEELDIMEQVEQVFKFSDLESVPRIISSPRFEFPASLRRRGIKEGKIELLIEIDKMGKARVKEVVSTTHPELVSVATSLIDRARFTQPMLDGEPVTVVGNMPLTLGAP